MRPALTLLTCLICSAIVDAASKGAKNDNYFVFPIYVKHNQIRRRGLLEEAGKVEIDGSVRVGYFYAVLPLGTPPKPFNVIVDTGSTVTYVPCYDCEHCGRHNDAPFNPKQSATSRWVQCSDSQCRRQRSVYYCDDASSNQCAYRISYAEQSSSEGKLVQDVFSFPNNGTKVPVTFGCESSETGEIYRQKPDGILGMGNNPGAFHSQLATAGAIPHMFSLCFGFPSGGAMLLGNAPVPGNPTYSWTRLSASGWGDFYAVDVDHIAYAGAPLGIPQDTFRSGYRTVMDSGTTFIYLTTPAYQKFAAAVTAAAAAAGFVRVNDGYGDICWRGAPADFEGLGKYFPDASFEFADGGRLALPAYRYMFQLAKKGTYCLAVFDNGDAGALIGGVATRNVLVQYDIHNKRVGFADMDCRALGEMPAPLFNLAKPAPKAAPVAATAAEPATAAATSPPAAAGTAAAAAAAPNPPEAPAPAKQVPAIQLQQQDTAKEKLVLPLSEEAIEKDLEVLGKAAEVYDDAYEEAIDIMEKAAKQVESMVAAAVGTSKTNASSSSSNNNSSVPGDATAAAAAAAAATGSKDAAAAAPAAPAAATSVLNPAHTPAAVAAEEDKETLASSQDEVPTDSSSSTASSPAEGVAPAANQSVVPAAAVDQSATVTTAPAAAAAAAAAGSTDASSTMDTTTATVPAQKEPSSSSSSSSAPSTTTAVSEDLLVPSGTSSGTAAAILAANSSTNATVEEPAPETVHWGTGSTQFSSADLHGGEKVLMGDTSPVAVVVLFVLLGALLLAVASVVAVVLRRRQIKAAGFSQLSATEIDCELAGISRRSAAAGFSDYDTDGGSRLIGSSDSHQQQQQQRQQYGGSSSGSSSRCTKGVAGQSQHSGLSVQPNAADGASAADGVDAVKSPVGGRDQQSPKPDNMAGLLPPPPRLGRTAASGAAQGLLPPPPQQQQRRVPSAVGATDVVATYSLDHDDDHNHCDQSPAAALAAAAGAAGAATSAAAAATEGLTAAMSEQSMELISLHEDAPKHI